VKENQLIEVSLRTEEIDKCVNCGLCLAVCPTYLVKGYEGLTARGKIVLLKALLDESIEHSARIADLFDDCLTCYACQTACPAGVKTQRLWTTARQDLRGLTVNSKLKHIGLSWTIGKPKLFEFEAKLAGLLNGFDKNDHTQARLDKWSLPVFKGAPHIKHLADEYPVVNEVGSVGLLLGCSVNLSTPWVADAVIKLLNAAGWRVVIPKDQVCCGAPAINNASWDIARKLAIRNISVYNKLGVDKVVSADGTCSSAFSHDYIELFQIDNQILTEAQKLAHITTDLGTLFAEALDDGRLKFGNYKKVITLHDSCHIKHVGGGNRWRDLLNAVDGLEIKELPDSDHCCGFGGSYTFFHNETSLKIGERKVKRILETGANEVFVGSPGCIMRLQSVVNNTNKNITVRHTAELLAEVVVN
jgi:glycolate oxidase iron-sulfur subunit